MGCLIGMPVCCFFHQQGEEVDFLLQRDALFVKSRPVSLMKSPKVLIIFFPLPPFFRVVYCKAAKMHYMVGRIMLEQRALQTHKVRCICYRRSTEDLHLC